MPGSIKNYPIEVPGLHENVVVQNQIAVADSSTALYNILTSQGLYTKEVSNQFEQLDELLDEEQLSLQKPIYDTFKDNLLISG